VTSHPCHARGCDRQIAPELLFCGPHWRLVPEELQKRVWSGYRAYLRWKRSREEYVRAKREAIEAVAAAESGRKKEPEQASLFGVAS
jgi:hypothetical protein